MIFADKDLRRLIALKELTITPYNPKRVQPASYDLSLGRGFKYTTSTGYEVGWEADEFTIGPQEFVLAHTEETVGLRRTLVAEVSGKSTWARKGLGVHITAGFIDPGFKGQITLEMYNFSVHPITLIAGQPIAQLVVARLSSPAESPYGSKGLGSKYQGQTGATPAR